MHKFFIETLLHPNWEFARRKNFLNFFLISSKVTLKPYKQFAITYVYIASKIGVAKNDFFRKFFLWKIGFLNRLVFVFAEWVKISIRNRLVFASSMRESAPVERRLARRIRGMGGNRHSKSVPFRVQHVRIGGCREAISAQDSRNG